MGTVGKGNSRARPAEVGYPPVQNFVNVEALCGVMETFSYSRPSEHTTRGIWAPPDWWEHEQLTIVIIPVGGPARRFTLAWTDPESPSHSSCKIDGSVYARTY